MRMPNSKKMSDEQKDVYLDAPLDGSVLVTGPPGTGKTVIAFLRAQSLSKAGNDVTVAMYNRVLSKYTGDVDEDLGVRTVHSWVCHWWDQLNLSEKESSIGDESSDTIAKERVYINCPFKEKDEAKDLGAKWDKKKKSWYVPSEKYRKNVSGFSRWMEPGKMALPKLNGSAYDNDWGKILKTIARELESKNIDFETINWGHLIIDEAQDFPSAMFRTLGLIMILFPEKQVELKPALTIFADENQRLNEETNSTIDDIRKNLYISDDREFSLTRNYRNTKQIAMLAAEFYAGLRTGIPDPPSSEGDIPLLVKCDQLNDAVEYIYNYAANHDNEEIGIIVNSDKIRKKFMNRLKTRIEKNRHLELQSYSSKKASEHNDVNKLEFDKGGVITVINKQSSKGLEFDAVFLPELQGVSVDPNDKDQFMMDMYVMISRARHYLAIMYTNTGDGDPAILSYLPTKNSGLLEYRNAK